MAPRVSASSSRSAPVPVPPESPRDAQPTHSVRPVVLGILLIGLGAALGLALLSGFLSGGLTSAQDGASATTISEDSVPRAAYSSSGISIAAGEKSIALGAPVAPPLPLDQSAAAMTEENTSTASSVTPRATISSAWLSLVVADVRTAIDSLSLLATEHGGFVDATTYAGATDDTLAGVVPSGSMVVRIPGSHLNAFLSDARVRAVRVAREERRATDVTDSIVDLDARIVNARATEKQYRALLDEAKDMKDIVLLTDRLAQIRADIESMESQATSTAREVSYATVSIDLMAVPGVSAEETGWRPSFVAREAWAGVVRGFTSLLQDGIRLVVGLPLFLVELLLALAPFVIAYYAVRWVVGRMFGIVLPNPLRRQNTKK